MKVFITFLFFVSGIASANNSTLKIKTVADNVYQHISYMHVEPWGMVGASGLVVVEGKNAHIIDTPWSQADTKKLIKWIEEKGLVAKSAVATHFHEDASAGIPFFNKSNINTYATLQTNKLLKEHHKEQASHVIPTRTFELVSDTIEIFYPGPGHSQDNIVVWLPKSKVLFGGCFVKNLKSKNLGNTEDASIDVWPASIKSVMNKYPTIEIVVPGHGKIGDTRLLEHTAALAMKFNQPEQSPSNN